MGMHELFDGSDAHDVDGGWVSFDVAEPTGREIVQQYLGKAVMEHSNPPDWAFPTERWRGTRDEAATHWRYVDAPTADMRGRVAVPLDGWVGPRRPGKDKDMKARLVADIKAQDAQPGDIELRKFPDGQVGGYAYRCPGCGQEDWLNVDDGTHGWTQTGPADVPTLRPSILHRPCGWHGYLTDGEFAPC